MSDDGKPIEAEEEFDFGKKKKKKPKAAPAADAAASGTGGDAAADGDADDGEFNFGKKKKKVKVVEPADEAAGADDAQQDAENDAAGGDAGGSAEVPWANSDRDYTYDEMVQRVFALLTADRPDLAGEKKKYRLAPPQVTRVGTKKTCWMNFKQMCDMMHRETDHVMQYVIAELGATASIDGKNRLLIRARFQPKQIEGVVRHYLNDYVFCRTCMSPDTSLQKENRLFFLICSVCNSKRTVATIRKGYEAQIGKRKKV